MSRQMIRHLVAVEFDHRIGYLDFRHRGFRPLQRGMERDGRDGAHEEQRSSAPAASL
jgi:hypothetical protein